MRIASILPLSVRKKRSSITNDAMVRTTFSIQFTWDLTVTADFAVSRTPSETFSVVGLASIW